MDDPTEFEEPVSGPARGRGEPRGACTARGRLALSVAAAWVLVDGLVGATLAWPCEPGETLPVRWLRMVADHPARSKLALTALLWGLVPGIRPTRAGAA